jgi:hypothetical protein
MGSRPPAAGSWWRKPCASTRRPGRRGSTASPGGGKETLGRRPSLVHSFTRLSSVLTRLSLLFVTGGRTGSSGAASSRRTSGTTPARSRAASARASMVRAYFCSLTVPASPSSMQRLLIAQIPLCVVLAM